MSTWEAGGVMGYFYEVLWWEFSDWSPIPIITASRPFESLYQSSLSPLIHLFYLCSLKHKGAMDTLHIATYRSMRGVSLFLTLSNHKFCGLYPKCHSFLFRLNVVWKVWCTGRCVRRSVWLKEREGRSLVWDENGVDMRTVWQVTFKNIG